MPAEPDDSTALTWRSRTIDEGKIVTISQVSQDIQQAEFARSSAPSTAFETAAQSRTAIHEAILTTSIEDTLLLRRFTLEEYHQLIDIDFFDEDERVELLAGVLVSMSPINPLHSNTVDLLAEIFGEIVTRGVTRVRTQGAISILETESEPEPDLVIFRVSGLDFTQRHPYPHEVLLVAEVSDSSLTYDRTRKGAIYAQAGIPEYWIWNLVDSSLEVYRDPHVPATGDALYQSKLTFRRGESVAPLAFPDCEVAVNDVLPSAGNTE